MMSIVLRVKKGEKKGRFIQNNQGQSSYISAL
jgi:hypothetical protein